MINLIFDLDQTLIHSLEEVNNNIFIANIKASSAFIIYEKKNKLQKSFKSKKQKTQKNTKTIKQNKEINPMIVFKRNNLNFFLRYCFHYFKVGFWTSGTTNYLYKILKNILLPDEYKKCICIIGREKSDNNSITYKDLISKKIFKIKDVNNNYVKDLNYIYNKTITKDNTILFDDLLQHKAINCNNNVLIPIYNYTQNNDNVLYHIIKELDKIKYHKTIARLNIKNLENKLFENSQPNNYDYTKYLKKYKESDSVYCDNEVNEYNNYSLILDVFKNKYKIMYIDKDSRKPVTKFISKNTIKYKYL